MLNLVAKKPTNFIINRQIEKKIVLFIKPFNRFTRKKINNGQQ